MKKIVLYTLFALATLVGVAQKVDRSKAPGPKAAPKLEIGEYQLFTLDNGMTVILVENHKLPRVSYNLNMNIDPVLQGNKAGYVDMAGSLLAAGTTKRSKNQIDEEVDFIGASLSTDAYSVSISGLTKHEAKLLDLLSDVALRPIFPEEELEKLKKQTLSGLISQKTDPDAISGVISSQAKYGTKHPYGEAPSETTVNAITREDLLSYYNSNFKPGSAYLVIVGDITLAKAQEQAQKYFGAWEGGQAGKRKFAQPKAPAVNTPVFVALPGAVQSVIDITYPIDLQPGSADAIPASMLNNVLGGSGFQTRLMQNLREDKAYTYGAYSSIGADKVIGNFSAGASVRNNVTDSAIVQFIFEMDRLVKEPIADSTLQTVKNIMIGNFARSLERPQTVAAFAYNIEKYNLPVDYYETYLQKLNAITKEDIQKVAAKYLQPANAYITVVGNKEVLESLRAFSPNKEVLTFNPDGTPYKELKEAPAGVTANVVLTNYINAIGGVKNLKKLKSYEQKGKMSMGPMSLTMTNRMNKQQQFSMRMVMQGQEVVKQLFDGTQTAMYQMGMKQEAGASDLEDMRMQVDPMVELNYAKYGITTKLLGVDMLNGKEVYVIELTKPTGVSTDYFDVASGLRVKSTNTITNETADGKRTVTTETLYLDYLTAGTKGIKFPSKIQQSADGQVFVIELTEVNLKPKFSKTEFLIK
jgi:zinc protease